MLELKIITMQNINLKNVFQSREELNLPCSFCNNSTLEIVTGTFSDLQTKESKEVFDVTQEVSCIKRRFVTLAKCSNKKCAEVYSILGRETVEECRECCHDAGEVCSYFCDMPQARSCYSIEYIDPPINFISLEKNIPKNIQDSIKDSFALFWCDCNATANKIRASLEALMNELKIESTGINEKGKKYDVSLHNRIEKFGENDDGKYADLAKRLLSIKWLGNAGSHEDNFISRENILDTYEILEHVLNEIFVRPGEIQIIEEKVKDLDKVFNPKIL